jgi:hypothetical protein
MAIGDDLVAAWDFASGSGGTIADAIGGVTLTLDGATFSGGGLLCDANDERAAVTAPAGLKFGAWPITIGVYFDLIGTPTNGAGIFGTNYAVPESSPFFGYAVDTAAGPVARAWFNSIGNFVSLSGATTLSGTGISLLITFTANRREIWLNGVSDANDTVPWTTPPSYDSTAEVFAGAYMDGLSRNPNIRLRQAYIWDADKTADVAAFAADPDGSSWAFTAPGPTITVQPTAVTRVLTNANTATFSVTATGTGTLTYGWELETSVGGGVYANLSDGNGATWTGQTASSCTATLTAKTLSGRRVRCNVTDDNGTTTSTAVALTIFDGPQVTTFGPTNGSGVSTATLTCDYVTGVGEAIEVAILLPDGRLSVSVTTT